MEKQKKCFLTRNKKNNEVKVNNESFRGVNMNCERPGTQHSLQTIQTAFLLTRFQPFSRGSCEDSTTLCDLYLNGEQPGKVTLYTPRTD
jgi:hypothetical protein